MSRGNLIVAGAMLLFDVIVGIALAVLIDPVVGAIAFVVSATISILTSRTFRFGSSGGRSGPASAPEAQTEPAAEEPAAVEATDPTVDPSYNPYAKED